MWRDGAGWRRRENSDTGTQRHETARPKDGVAPRRRSAAQRQHHMDGAAWRKTGWQQARTTARRHARRRGRTRDGTCNKVATMRQQVGASEGARRRREGRWAENGAEGSNRAKGVWERVRGQDEGARARRGHEQRRDGVVGASVGKECVTWARGGVAKDPFCAYYTSTFVRLERNISGKKESPKCINTYLFIQLRSFHFPQYGGAGREDHGRESATQGCGVAAEGRGATSQGLGPALQGRGVASLECRVASRGCWAASQGRGGVVGMQGSVVRARDDPWACVTATWGGERHGGYEGDDTAPRAVVVSWHVKARLCDDNEVRQLPRQGGRGRGRGGRKTVEWGVKTAQRGGRGRGVAQHSATRSGTAAGHADGGAGCKTALRGAKRAGRDVETRREMAHRLQKGRNGGWERAAEREDGGAGCTNGRDGAATRARLRERAGDGNMWAREGRGSGTWLQHATTVQGARQDTAWAGVMQRAGAGDDAGGSETARTSGRWHRWRARRRDSVGTAVGHETAQWGTKQPHGVQKGTAHADGAAQRADGMGGCGVNRTDSGRETASDGRQSSEREGMCACKPAGRQAERRQVMESDISGWRVASWRGGQQRDKDASPGSRARACIEDGWRQAIGGWEMGV
ncbi:hypothetical protein DENSPDRAFT_854596 [Dentipellis sp. KUC8613]|nr:hypothetical protein DENSPDRAFT_854596 [Dentipellis sp. KUC8613]